MPGFGAAGIFVKHFIIIHRRIISRLFIPRKRALIPCSVYMVCANIHICIKIVFIQMEIQIRLNNYISFIQRRQTVHLYICTIITVAYCSHVHCSCISRRAAVSVCRTGICAVNICAGCFLPRLCGCKSRVYCNRICSVCLFKPAFIRSYGQCELIILLLLY